MIGKFLFTRALPLLLSALLLPNWAMAQSAASAQIPVLEQPALHSAKAQRAVLRGEAPHAEPAPPSRVG